MIMSMSKVMYYYSIFRKVIMNISFVYFMSKEDYKHNANQLFCKVYTI